MNEGDSGPHPPGGPPSPADRVAPPRLVIGYDGSPSAERAVRFGLRWAGSSRGSVWLVHATTHERHVAEPVTDEELSAPARAIVRAMETWAADARSQGVAATTVVREGSARDVVIAVAAEVRADAILLGTRGRTDANRLLLGSVSAHVVAHAPVPTVVVP